MQIAINHLHNLKVLNSIVLAEMSQQIAELNNSLNEINTKLETMKAMFDELDRKQTMQKEEVYFRI